MARSTITTATHTGYRGRTVVDGLDVLVRDLSRAAETVRPEAEKVVVEYAGKAAQAMRDRVPIDEGGLLDSITSDEHAEHQGGAVYAEAGPDRSENDDAYVARWVEYGTASHAIAARGRAKRGRKGKRARVLASPSAIYGRTVQHPGSKKHPFASPAADEVLPAFTRAVGDLGDLGELGDR